MRTLIKNTRMLDFATWTIVEGHIHIQDAIITSVSNDPPTDAYDVGVDGFDYICTPGFVNGHLHPSKEVYANYSEGESYRDVISMTHELYAYEREDDRYWISLYSLKESLLRGTTCAGIFTSRYESDLEALRALGMRGSVYYVLNDAWLGEGCDPIIKKEREIFGCLDEYLRVKVPRRIKLHAATASEVSCSTDILRKLHEYASHNGISFSMHAAEGRGQSEKCKDIFGETSIQYLHSSGILTDSTVLVHVSHITDEEIRILRDTGAGIIHCPLSNSFTAAGLMPLSKLLNADTQVGLGTDSAMLNPVNDIINECYFTTCAHGMGDTTNKVDVRTILSMASAVNSKLLGHADAGTLGTGVCADINMYRYDPADAASYANPLSFIVNVLRARPQQVIVDGCFVVKDGQLQSVDEKEIDRRYNEIRRRYINNISALSAGDTKGLKDV